MITGQDVPDTQYGVSPARYDEYVLAKDRVRHVGDEVAVKVISIDDQGRVKLSRKAAKREAAGAAN